MLGEITWPQFLEWYAFDQLDPFGEERQDIRTANVVQTLVNLHRGQNRDPYKLSEFVLPFGDAAEAMKPKQQSWQSMKAAMMEWSAALGTPPPPTVAVPAVVEDENG